MLDDYSLEEISHYIDWSPFFMAWELKGKFPRILDRSHDRPGGPRVVRQRKRVAGRRDSQEADLVASGVYGFWPAAADGDDIVVFSDSKRDNRAGPDFTHCASSGSERDRRSIERWPITSRQCKSGRDDYCGAFVVTAGLGARELAETLRIRTRRLQRHHGQGLADRLAEAFAELVHLQARQDWGYGRDEALEKSDLIAEKYRGIRPAPGYPSQPDHSEKRTLFELLDAEQSAGVQSDRNVRHGTGGECLRLAVLAPASPILCGRTGWPATRSSTTPVAKASRWTKWKSGCDPIWVTSRLRWASISRASSRGQADAGPRIAGQLTSRCGPLR